MHLWTEYEGSTLASYPLGRLSRSEGRSAFFLTTSPDEQPALLRLTESHFDEGELIGRWRKIATVANASLQAIKDCGQTTFDGVALAYCLLEASDASLSDVLRERVLSAEETTEVAEAVAVGLAALHAAGLVHGHVDATNVFAMGETVKLRSDCARECTGDFEDDTAEAREALRQRDVHDLGLLLRRCLTPQWQEASAEQLLGPFDRIVRRALNGSITAEGIVAEFEALKPAPPPVVRPPQPAAPIPAVAANAAPAATAAVRTEPAGTSPGAPYKPASVRNAGGSGTPRTPGSARSTAAADANTPDAVIAAMAQRSSRTPAPANRDLLPVTADREEAGTAAGKAYAGVRLNRLRNRHQTGTASVGEGVMQRFVAMVPRSVSRKAWIASGAAAAVFGVILWNTTGGTPRASAGSSAALSESAPAKPLPSAAQVAAAPVHSKPSPIPSAPVPQNSLLAAGAHAGWHVIAYTYNHEQQAQAKVTQLRRKYTALQPQVFSPSGRAPYFVALGGPSDAAAAMSLRNRARQAGLPRDTYARNF